MESDGPKALSHLSPEFVHTYTVEFFIEVMRGYFSEECRGENKERRIARLIAEVQQERPELNEDQLVHLQVLADEYYGLNESVLTRYANIFFHETIDFPSSEFMRMIRESS
jgi:hypothetical protein